MKRGRVAAVVVSAVLAAAFLVPAFGLLPPLGIYPGPYGDAVVPLSLERATTNVTATVAYDVREFDTLGEETILVATVAGIAVLLRSAGEQRGKRGEQGARELHASRPAVRLASADVLPLGLVLGAYMTLHATETPGGGFQGGAIIASALTLIYLGWDYDTWCRLVREPASDLVESAGMLLFLGLVLVPLGFGGVFAANWLPPGTLGQLGSGGAMFVVNFGIALAVAAGFVLIVGYVLRELHEGGSGDGGEEEPA